MGRRIDLWCILKDESAQGGSLRGWCPVQREPYQTDKPQCSDLGQLGVWTNMLWSLFQVACFLCFFLGDKKMGNQDFNPYIALLSQLSSFLESQFEKLLGVACQNLFWTFCQEEKFPPVKSVRCPMNAGINHLPRFIHKALRRFYSLSPYPTFGVMGTGTAILVVTRGAESTLCQLMKSHCLNPAFETSTTSPQSSNCSK